MLMFDLRCSLLRVTSWGVTCALGALLLTGASPAYAQVKKPAKPPVTRPAAQTAPAAQDAATPSTDAPATPEKIDNIYRYLLDATVLIVIKLPDEQGMITGTGWVVDAERCLVVTNQHVVEQHPAAYCLLPKFSGTKLQTNMQNYAKPDTIDAVVLDSDPNFDLALLKLASLPRNIRTLKISTRDVSPGEKVHTIAGLPSGTEGMWVYGNGTVRQISEGRLANGSLTALMESDIPINQGNSGAAVIDDQGEVVAVAEGYLTQVRGTSLCVAAESVKKYLDTILPLAEPETAEQWLAVGQRAFEQGRPDAAMEAFSSGLELDDKLVALHVGRGMLLIDAQDAETAIADFTTALELDPKNVDALQGRALCQEAMGDAEAALADLTKAIQRNPKDAALYNLRGCVRTRQDDHEKAEADFNRAIALDGKDHKYLINRCITRRNLGNIVGALQDIGKVCQENPNNLDAANELGLTLYTNEQYPNAAEVFQAAMNIDQTNPIYPQNLGDALQAQDQHEAALQAYDASLKLNNQNSYVWYAVGLSQHELGQLDAAVNAYQQALAQDEEYAEAWYALGQTYEALGQKDEAQQAISKARELNPEIESSE